MASNKFAARKLYELPVRDETHLDDSKVAEAKDLLDYTRTNIIGINKMFDSCFGSRKGMVFCLLTESIFNVSLVSSSVETHFCS